MCELVLTNRDNPACCNDMIRTEKEKEKEKREKK
jgi:hypothetical protein